MLGYFSEETKSLSVELGNSRNIADVSGDFQGFF